MFTKAQRTRDLWKLVATLVATTALVCIVASPAFAHGVALDQRSGEAVEVTAAYDNGDPVSEGQVVVYAPDEPSEPWATGTTDEEGRYIFMPDESKPGAWSVQVREAGHGANTSVEVGGEGEEAVRVEQSGDDNGPVQMGLMGALGVWGCIGTALFFWRKRS